MTELLPSIKKLRTLANPKTCYFWWSTLQVCPPFMFFHCQIQDFISCYQIQKDDLLDFFYCMVSLKMYTRLPNCDLSDKNFFLVTRHSPNSKHLFSLHLMRYFKCWTPCLFFGRTLQMEIRDCFQGNFANSESVVSPILFSSYIHG